MKRLPTELIDYIIDFHHSDIMSLEDCSLVCRNWLPASRFHLFGTVHVRSSNVRSFVDLLAAPSSTIAGHIHTLNLYFSHFDTIPVFDVIAPYLGIFVTIKSLSLIGQVLAQEESLPRELGRVGNMELTRVYYSFTFPEFGFSFEIGDHGPSTFLSTLHVIRSVVEDREQTLSRLPIVVQLPAVSELKLAGMQANHLPIARAMLKSGGQAIRAVTLNVSLAPPDLGLISDYVDLIHNSNLRLLSIEFLDLREAEGVVSRRTFHSIVQRISSSCLTHILVEVSVNSCVDLTWLDCKKVADELNHPRFSELQDVRIDIFCHSDKIEKRDEIMAWVREEMSCLDKRGILSVPRFWFRD